MMPAWQPLLDWWFGDAEAASVVAAQCSKLWFGYQASQDAEARERFGELSAQALAGGLQDWAERAEGWLALILLLDQLPRMIHRATPQAFAGDARALQLVRWGLEQGLERQLPAIRQVFVYLVLEHAEDLITQNLAVERFRVLGEQVPAAERELFAGYLDYAVRHQQVIARFGRFPHRNMLLARDSTPTELAFLQEPGSRF